MSLLEEWHSQELGRLTLDYQGDDGGIDTGLGEYSDDGNIGAASPRSLVAAPIFSLETIERNVARGRGQVTAVVAANNVVALVTSRGWFLRYDLSQSSTPVTELELSKSPDVQATGLWADPTGSHYIVAAMTMGGWETFYMHAAWKKPRVMTKLKGVHVTAAAWNPESVTEASTGEVALGTERGSIISVFWSERDTKERGGKPVLELAKEPLMGLRQAPLQDRRLLLLAATPTRLYAFVGLETLEGLGAAYPRSASLTNFIELPSEHPCGALSTFSSPGGSPRPKRFAWLAGPGLYRGGLDLSSPHDQPGELDALVDHNLLPLPINATLEEHPIAVAQTEYHEMVLYPSRLQAINRVSQTLVQDLPLAGWTAGGVYPLGITEDSSSGSLFIFTADSLIEVIVNEEDRDMWKVHLERRDYPNALRRCKTQAQRDAVTGSQAAAAFERGDLSEAARLWGGITTPPPSFEDVALKFVEAGAPEALQGFLLARLEALPPSNKAQATMVATWLTELFLDCINRALLESSEGAGSCPRVQQLTQDLRAFLTKHVQVLDARTTINLLASYGRSDDLMHFASARQDNEAVLEYLLQRGDAAKALAVLRRPDVSRELFYKFAPGLMAVAPGETIDACIAANPALDPKRLLPALLRFAEEGTPPGARSNALRYVTFCLQTAAAASEPAVHQLAVALYCSQADEEALLGYLASARDPLGKPQYNPQVALRLARQQGLRRACMELLWELRLYEDAVALALELDVRQATRLANRAQDDESLQRKLWLAIACHLVEAAAAGGADQAESIKQVNALMREAGGLIKIEDVLPLFPDFVQIDAFKDAICQSLEEYNTQIEGLKSEMDDATRIADSLRRDVRRLEHRLATLDMSEPCAVCGRPVGEAPPPSNGPAGGAIPPFFLFPTGNAFHGTCLAAEVAESAPAAQKRRIQRLLVSLSRVPVDESAEGLPENVRELQRQLKAEIAAEDPYNGEVVIRNIDQPFVLPTEQEEIASWQL